MKIVTRAMVELPHDAPSLFDFTVDPDNFARMMRALPPIPGVERAHVIGGGPQKAGSRRLIGMSDGSEIIEDVLELDRPHRHRYRWTKPKFPFSLLVRSAEGDWTFTRAGRGTRIDWKYSFELTTPLVYPLGRLVVLQFRRWMQRSLERIEGELPAAHAAGPDRGTLPQAS